MSTPVQLSATCADDTISSELVRHVLRLHPELTDGDPSVERAIVASVRTVTLGDLVAEHIERLAVAEQ